MSTRILVVDDSPLNRKLTADVLQRAGHEVITAEDGASALKLLEQEHIDLVLLDVMMPGMDGYEVCKRIRANPKTTYLPVMMLTAQDTVESKIKGFEAGADDYLTKPFEPTELQARVQVLLRRLARVQPKEITEEGKLIAVFSLRGGVGVSTLAANLAVALAQLWGRPSVLVDMALTAGQAALMLNLPLRHTWTDIARLPVEEIDAEFVQNVLLRHPSGAHVLPAPRHPAEGELVTAEKVRHVLDLLRKQFHYMVVDLPHDFSETTLTVLDQAEEILLVLAPELASIRTTAAVLDTFAELGYEDTHIRLVLNWTFEKRGLVKGEIERVLKQKINVVIPYASDLFVPAINLGIPPVFDQPDTSVSALFEDLAFVLSKPSHKKKVPASPTKAWQRVANRIQHRRRSK